MDKKKIFRVLLLTATAPVLCGFIIGCYLGLRSIIANKYFSYNLFRSAAVCLEEAVAEYCLFGIVAAGIIMLLIGTAFCIPSARPKLSRIAETLTKSRLMKVLVAPIGLAFLVVFGISLYIRTSTAAADKYPHIVFISIDDLRPDHLGCYGYQRNTSPSLDAFAYSNILFENCFAHQPWTLPSHLSMLTSLYSITHGMHRLGRMDPAITTLPEILRNAGYVTLGFASCLWLSPSFGFDEGFTEYMMKTNYSPDNPARNAEYQNKEIIKYLRRHKKDKIFLFIHYFDVHSDMNKLPYEAPPPFDKAFSAYYQGDFKGGDGSLFASEYLASINRQKTKIDSRTIKYIMSLYDNGIAYTDSCIGSLIEELKKLDIYNDALIIITSDHGEEFQEHGYLLHSNPNYHDEVVHVPLLVKLPSKSPGAAKSLRIKGLVGLVDIMPSILDFIDIKKPKYLQGKSFMNDIHIKDTGKPYVFGFGSDSEKYIRFYIRSDKWKLLGGHNPAVSDLRLYNIIDDPDEQNDLSQTLLQTRDFLVEKTTEKISACCSIRKRLTGKNCEEFSSDNDKNILSKSERSKLKALGYLQ